MTVAGRFSTMAVADVIQWARSAQRTGVLTLSDEQQKRIQLTFIDGRIISSSTSEQHETYTAYLRYHGLCSDSDIEEARKIQLATGAMLAAVLVREGRITMRDAVDTLCSKTIEDVCDVFLWRDGSFEFDPHAKRARASISINLDPIRIVYEGLQRADIWSRISAVLHPSAFYEPTGEAVTEGSEWNDLRMVRLVYPLLDGNTTLGELAARLPFGRYKVYRAVSELLEKRLIRPADATGTSDREKRIQRKLLEARNAVETGRWTEAMESLSALVAANPGRTEIISELLRVTEDFRRSVYEHNFTPEDVPVVTIGPDAIQHMTLEPAEAFIMTRIDGRMTVREILRISPLTEFEGLRVFKRLLSAKVIDFPHRTLDRPPSNSFVPARA